MRVSRIERGPEQLRLLIVDDEIVHARLLKANLARPGRLDVEVVPSAEGALERLGRGGVDAVLADLMMPGISGIEMVRRIRATDASLPIILMTAHASLELAVEGIRAGATDFLQKPINVTAVLALIERAVVERPLREEITEIKARRLGEAADRLAVGDDPRMDAVRYFAKQLAQVPESRVLITGESGTGKSLLARVIHELSGATGRFVEVNCAGLPAHLIESELFGYEKGAFTDAKNLKRGLVELADRGTLFLDEIGALPLELQAKLLLFLENREFWRVGGTTPIPVRTRVVAATNEDLRKRARDRSFRQDLLYRLDVASIEMPPLRVMPCAIVQLAERFAQELSREMKRPCPTITPASFERLVEYSWPGNIRELRNAVERALIFHSEGPLVVVPPVTSSEPTQDGHGVALELGLTLDEVEQKYLAATLAASPLELDEIARNLGISRKTLWDKRRRYGLAR